MLWLYCLTRRCLASGKLFPLVFLVFMFAQPMGLVYDLNLFSRNSHKAQASDRRRVKPTSYDKYGYPFATFGGSSYQDPVVHVLHVEPGVVVNFVEGPSGRHRPWPHPPIPDHKFSRNGGRYFQGRDPFVINPRSFPNVPPPPPPPPRNNYESRPLPLPPVPCNNLPPSPRFMVDEHHPDAHFSMPHHPQPYYGDEDDDPLGPSRPSLHVADPVFLGARNSPQHVPPPLDVALIPNSPEISDDSFHSPSHSSSDSSSHRYYDASHSSVSSDSHHSPPPSIAASPRVRRFSDFSMPPSLTPNHTRSVRFHDNPVLPDHWERRKGWFNRRGDQLWDNDGSYVSALEHEQYPADLQNYPEPGRGWMNEEGTVIDMKRRLIRKKLRPVLKKPSL